MNPEKTSIEIVIAYFIIAAGIVGGVWKSLPPFLTWWDGRGKAKKEQAKIHKSESADALKATLEHEFKLEELADKRIQQILEYQQLQIDKLKGDVESAEAKAKTFEDAEDVRKERYLKKLFLLRETQRELQLFEADVLKGVFDENFQAEALKRLQTLKLQTEEHEKLLT